MPPPPQIVPDKKIFLIFLVIFPLTCVALFLWYFHGNNSNHTGMEFLLFFWLIVICAIVSAIKARKARKFIIPLLINVLAAVFFYMIDHLNIMVEYDRWLYRGMPEPFESSKQKPEDLYYELSNYFRAASEKYEKGLITREALDRATDYVNEEMEKQKEEMERRKEERERPLNNSLPKYYFIAEYHNVCKYSVRVTLRDFSNFEDRVVVKKLGIGEKIEILHTVSNEDSIESGIFPSYAMDIMSDGSGTLYGKNGLINILNRSTKNGRVWVIKDPSLCPGY